MARAIMTCAQPGCTVRHSVEDATYEEAQRRVRLRFVDRGLYYCATCAARKDREARQTEAR